jgi:hypothetical protein
LRALFSDDLTAEGGSASQIAMNGEFDHSKVLASNYATLTVIKPSGEDLVVWEWMKAHDSPVPDGFPEFPSFVIDHHPGSGYALYAAAWYPKRDRAHEYALLEGVIKQFPSSSLAEQLKARLMYTHRDDAGTAYQRHDLQKAVAEWDKARGIAADLAQNGRSSRIRQDAREVVASAPSREQILAPPPADE